ncbi:hypothetical protein ACFLZ8_01420 [Planctomycetota bacterium]
MRNLLNWGGRLSNLTEEQIDQVMENLKERDPERAEELEKLRQTANAEEFLNELRQYAEPEISEAILDSMLSRGQREFLDWLEEYVPEEWENLENLKQEDPSRFLMTYDRVNRTYSRTFERGRDNPELSRVLVLDMELRERQDVLVQRIRFEGETEELAIDLEEIVADRYDLNVIEKQIGYDELLKRVEDLQKLLQDSLAEIEQLKTDEAKAQNVESQIQTLTREPVGGPRPWDRGRN